MAVAGGCKWEMGKEKDEDEDRTRTRTRVPWSHCHGHKNVQSISYGATFAHTLLELIMSEGMKMVLMHGAKKKKQEKEKEKLMETIFLLSGLLDFTFYLLLLLG